MVDTGIHAKHWTRQQATKALGDRFSLQKFRNVGFETGSVPLDIFERQVDAYIRAAAN